MVIFDESDNVIESPDLELGYLRDEEIPVWHRWVVDVQEEGHHEVIAEYPNGGKDLVWVVDTAAEGHWETVDDSGEVVEGFDQDIALGLPTDMDNNDIWYVQRYVRYSEEELAQIAAEREEAERHIRYSSQVMAAIPMMARMMAPTMSDAQCLSVSMLFEEWEPDTDYEADVVLRHGEEVYRVAKAHRSQPQWVPRETRTESLYTRITVDPETGYDVWQRPTGEHDAYDTGDRVLYPDADGRVYESTIDGNSWSPDEYPQGWREVSG